ncbi:MAG: MFS transporter [Planctomycetota bacterium]
MSTSASRHWYQGISRQAWRALVAAMCGWMLDAMDVMLYAFALTSIRDEFDLTGATAGALASVTLVASAAGGILFGALADRIGRVRALTVSILVYSAFTAMTATAGSIQELVLWRTLVGIGLGGEWSAGSVLVAESWPAEHRGKAIGLMQSGWAIGYLMAALLAALILPTLGWRPLFAVGAAPALLAAWIRTRVEEPAVWKESSQVRGTTAQAQPVVARLLLATAVTSCVLFAYWGLFTWMPTFLAAPAGSGGAGMGVVKSSLWIVPMQIGAFLGYASFGFLGDRIGRRPAFIGFLVAAAALVPAYGACAGSATALLILGPFIGFFGHGYFSVFGALLSEIFPTRRRATLQGIAYNAGRALSALAPATIGSLADRHGLAAALTLTSVFFLIGAGLMFCLPETKGRAL